VYALTLSAQNLGITTPGTTSYPQTNFGNTLTGNSNDAGNFLTVDQFTTTVPVTAILIRTFGTVSSGTNNVKVSIYNDDGFDLPLTLLFPEVSATVTANTTSTITIPNIFLPAGKYWLAFNLNSNNSNANFITKSTGVTGAIRKFTTSNWAFGTAFPTNPSHAIWSPGLAGTQDNLYIVGVPIEGYAKATKATLPVNSAFSSMNFYTHAAGNVRLAIYSDNGTGTAPTAKQWESADITINGTGQPKLTSVNISTGTPSSLTLNSGIYWLAWQWNTVTTGPSYRTGGAANSGNALIQSYGAFPSSWTGGTASTENWTMYATYCAQPTASVTGQTNITCYAANDGTITVSASGGIIPYTFSVDNGANYLPPTSGNTRTFTGLLPNTAYKIKVKDNAGCVSQ